MYSPQRPSQPDDERQWPRPVSTTTEPVPPPPTYLPPPRSRRGALSGETQALRTWIRIPSERPLLTYILLAAIVLVFVPAILAPDTYNALIGWGANNRFAVLGNGEWWRPITATFLHGNPLHIALNGYALYMLGIEVEAFFGRVRFAMLYSASGLAGSVASIAFMPVVGASVGASGAIFGLIGALGVYFGLNRRLFGKMGTAQFWNIIIVIVINLGIGLVGIFPIDNSAHIGGLVAGSAMGFVLCPRYKMGDWFNPLVRDLVNLNKGPLTWIAATLIALIIGALFLNLWLLYNAGNWVIR